MTLQDALALRLPPGPRCMCDRRTQRWKSMACGECRRAAMRLLRWLKPQHEKVRDFTPNYLVKRVRRA